MTLEELIAWVKESKLIDSSKAFCEDSSRFGWKVYKHGDKLFLLECYGKDLKYYCPDTQRPGLQHSGRLGHYTPVEVTAKSRMIEEKYYESMDGKTEYTKLWS